MNRAEELLARFGDKKPEPVARAWCYLCGSEHRFHEPCLTRSTPRTRRTFICGHCRKPFYVRSDRERMYCTPDCSYAAKLARKRVRKDRRERTSAA